MFKWGKFFKRQQTTHLWRVLHSLRQYSPEFWLKQAVCLTMPFAQTTPLQSSGLPKAMQQFIAAYEPKTVKNGIFIHQQQVLCAALQQEKHILLTSSTGSGKSLCFWAWIVHKLVTDPKATALVCFPTQALLWGQTVRLQELSSDCVVSESGLAYSGRLIIDGAAIDWSVWKGSGKVDSAMALHEKSRAFQQARLRIATIDKVHYSLLRRDIRFAARLQGVVLDEAHQYQGLFGAQVAYLLKRIGVFKNVLGQKMPQMFLASATLPEAKNFAAMLLSVSPDEIVHQTDAIHQKVELINWDEAEERLAHPPQAALCRLVLFYDKQLGRPALDSLLMKNFFCCHKAVYFSPSKYSSRLLKQRLAQAGGHAVIYDADLPLPERRKLEKAFRLSENVPVTIIATNALELGVDIEGLDICLIPSLPDQQAAFLQQIGRVGRRQDKPGLVIVSLSTSLYDEQKRQDVTELFTVSSGQKFFLPIHLEWVKLKSMAALYRELRQAQKEFSAITTIACQQALQIYYGENPSSSEIKQRLTSLCGFLDFTQPFWPYWGFRGSVDQDKVPLVCVLTHEVIALLDRIALMRNAHLGANYLDHQNNYWRVIAYCNEVGTTLAIQSDRGIQVDQIKRIDVVPAKREVLTRGICHSQIQLIKSLCPPYLVPSALVYGQWLLRQSVVAYRKVRLPHQQVTIERLPRREILWQDRITMGWTWKIPFLLTLQEDLCLREMTSLFQTALTEFLASAAGVSAHDLTVGFSARNKTFEVMDLEQGGNGVAAYLLDKGMVLALQKCLKLLNEFRGPVALKSNFAGAIHEITDIDQACQIVRKIIESWSVDS